MNPLLLALILLSQTSVNSASPANIAVSNKVISASITTDIQQSAPSDRAQNEAQAIAALKEIYQQELKYQQANGKYLDAKELFKLELIDGELANAAGVEAGKSKSGKFNCKGDHQPTHYGYQFEIKVDNSSQPAAFAAMALPAAGVASNNNLAINDQGVVSKKPAPPGIVRRSEGAVRATIVYKVEPERSTEAKEKHIKGDVIIKILVGEDGNVISAKAVSGPPLLQEAALAAVKQWRFKPTSVNQMPLRVESTVTINFK